MKRMLAPLVAAVAMVVAAPAADAQLGPATPFALEIRGGAAIPTGDLTDFVNSGYTVGVNGQFQAAPRMAVYAGYTLSSFGYSDADPLAEGVSLQLRGFDAGVHAAFGMPGLRPFARGGVVFYQTAERGEGALPATDHELGFEVGGGLEYALGPSISVTPRVGFVSVGGAEFVKVDVGMRIRL